MDSQIDHGAIIDQKEVRIKSTDTSLELYARVLEAEKELVRRNLKKLVSGEYQAVQPEFAGKLNNIVDFRDLCALDLDAIGTLRDHLNLLRALSHGNWKNAYFKDEAGRKVFVKIELEH